MANETNRKPPVVVEQIPSIVGNISALASANAPFVYFDRVSNYGLNGGIANMTLEIIRFHPSAAGVGVHADRVVVAHLRMSLQAVLSLKAAIAGIELVAKPDSGGQKN